MKTLRFIVASTLLLLTATAFASGNSIEDCESCLAPEYITMTENDSAALADSGVSAVLNQMTVQVQEQLKVDGVNTLLIQMTRKVHESINSEGNATLF